MTNIKNNLFRKVAYWRFGYPQDVDNDYLNRCQYKVVYIGTTLLQMSELDVMYPVADIRIRRCRYYYSSADVRVGCRKWLRQNRCQNKM